MGSDLGGADLETVLGKAVAILRSFGPEDQTLALAEIVRRTGLPKGSAHRVAADQGGHPLRAKGEGG